MNNVIKTDADLACECIDQLASECRLNPTYYQREAKEIIRKLQSERDAAMIPICVGKPIIEILAKEGAWASINGNSLIAADCLFQKNPYSENRVEKTYYGLRWHKLTALSQGDNEIEVMGSTCIDGIGVIVQWKRIKDVWTKLVMDTEGLQWSDIDSYSEGDEIPEEPPTIWDDQK